MSKIRVQVRKAGEPAKVPVTGDYITLEALLKHVGACQTGGEAKMRIQGGEFRVNGEVCPMRGKKLRPGDRVTGSGINVIIEQG